MMNILEKFTHSLNKSIKETIKDEMLEVSEIFEKDGVITFGCTYPIIYKKI
ncbi:hypothetical protein [Clostridium sp.]|uniref:hypothetical protein n=1 Tax=Clostridium sp. TaxID=1506 RepID=UPI002FC7D46F